MEEIQSCWQVPAIAHFCNLFKNYFGLPEFDYEELEYAFLSSTSIDVNEPGFTTVVGNDLLRRLIISLLSGYFDDQAIDIKGALPILGSVKDCISMAIANDINESFRKKEARLRVVEVQDHLEGGKVLVTPTRYHLKDGCLKKMNKSTLTLSNFKKCWFFLFNDLLVWTTVPNSKGNCKLKYMFELIDMSIKDVADNPAKNKDFVFMFDIKAKERQFRVGCSNEADKKEWMDLLNEYIKNVNKNAATLQRQRPQPHPLVEKQTSLSHTLTSEGLV